MTTNNQSNRWRYEEEELPRWASSDRRQPQGEFDFGIGVPAETPQPDWPLFGRLVFFRLAVAAAFYFMLSFGSGTTDSHWIAVVLTNTLLGFALGLAAFVITFMVRYYELSLESLADKVPGAPTVRMIVLPAVVLPGFFLLSQVMHYAFADRFLGVALAGLLCMYVFHRWGHRPIDFMQELLLADIAVPPEVRRQRPRFPGQPDLVKLGILLLAVLLVPAYLSNTWGIVAAVALCGVAVHQALPALKAFGELPTVLAALWNRSRKVAFEYLDYAPTDRYHWQPSETLRQRRWKMVALLGSFDLALLAGLTFFMPWELFAAIFVPDFKVNLLLVPEYQLTDYRWLRAPLLLYTEGNAYVGYLFCFVFGIILYSLLPLVALFLIYLDRLVALEALAQEFKRTRT